MPNTGDTNNCWDYCFGKEEQLSDALVNIIDNQRFDGIDIDYEYCYDVADKQAGRCSQATSAYSDVKAQTFLDELTALLRQKLDDLQDRNGYNRGRYEVTHTPMDTDLTPATSMYFQILHNRRADLDFLMPQFYNGATRPAVDGVEGTGAGAESAAAIFGSLSNQLFDGEPHKVRRSQNESCVPGGNARSCFLLAGGCCFGGGPSHLLCCPRRLSLVTALATVRGPAPTSTLPRPCRSLPTSKASTTENLLAMAARFSGWRCTTPAEDGPVLS